MRDEVQARSHAHHGMVFRDVAPLDGGPLGAPAQHARHQTALLELAVCALQLQRQAEPVNHLQQRAARGVVRRQHAHFLGNRIFESGGPNLGHGGVVQDAVGDEGGAVEGNHARHRVGEPLRLQDHQLTLCAAGRSGCRVGGLRVKTCDRMS